ncbi:MotA/TolQ/ExbB proton channel family protein [Saccharicrinis aurantiacus]|uniref:MotA/TolQ/ExbB proton channel family protein n=1 Tax=Saccharicrinis aurantiacus TaxID=1849719 RepID=UPI0024914BF0|nr:MotA/TolQ/ExbB proton channel family protein [Saccharicrinis aurantiacus]
MSLIEQIVIKLNEGGPVFTYTILCLILASIVLFISGLFKVPSVFKTIAIIKQIGWLSIAWGVLGRTFGLIVAFDTLQQYNNLTPKLLGDGLKMALLSPMLGILSFVIARIFIAILYLFSKQTTLS